MANLSNINNKFLVTTGGNVGIGVTGPSRQFEVASSGGIVAVLTSTTGGSYISMEDSSTTSDSQVRFGAIGNNAIIKSGGTTTLTLNSSQNATFAGNVTITGGTTSGLNITTSGTQDTININRAANNDNAITKYQTASADKWIVGLRNTGDDKFRFYSYGTSTDVLTIDQATGNVGIGTSSPGAKLDIATTGSVAKPPSLRISNAAAAGYLWDIWRDNTTGYLNIGSTTNGTDYGAHVTIKDVSGNVGIGTDSPSTDLQVIGTVRADVFGVQDDSTNPSSNTSTRVTSPAGATYDDQSNSASTGVLSVILPTTASSTMLSFTLRVFDYANNESFDVNVAGYWYSSGLWTNTSARIESQSNVERNFNVRFGKNNTTNKGWVGVGETTTNWSYVKFAVLNFQAAHVNDDLERWDDLWDTAVLTSLTGYTTLVTKNNNQVNNWARSGENLYYGSGTGNVGIGTTNPGQKLEVIGRTKITQSGDALRINSSDANGSYATWQNNGSNIGYIGAGYHLWGSPNNIATSLGIRAQTRLDLGIQASVHMTILNTGNVGIGTTTPARKFVVSNGGASGIEIKPNYVAGVNEILSFDRTTGATAYETMRFNGGDFQFQIGGSEKMRIDSAGSVGIGVISPSVKLEVQANTTSYGVKTQYSTVIFDGNDSQLDITSSSAGSWGSSINFVEGAGTTNTDIWSISRQTTGGNGDSGLRFNFGTGNYHNNPTKIVFASNGAIGIGGTNYGAAGEVLTSNGNAAPSWQAGGGSSPWTTSGNDIYNNNSGNIGIGVSSPVAKLDVNGDCSYEDVNTGTTTVTTATKTLEFTVFLDGGSASLGVTYSLLTMNQPQYNTSVAVATMEYGASLDSGTGRVGGSVMAVTKWAGNWYDEDNIELGFAGTTSGKPSLFWEYGVLKVTAKRYCNMVCRIRLTYRGFGSSTTSPVTKNYPT